MALFLVIVLVACYELFEHRTSRHIGASPAVVVTGLSESRPLPDVTLTNEAGRPTSLAALRGKVVVLAPFATLCGLSCAATTSAFSAIETELHSTGVSDKVALVELSVDPGHDSPARLASFARQAGPGVELLTGTPAQVGALWHALGQYYQSGPPSAALPRDWLTNTAASYGVSYANAVYFIGPDGKLRISDFAPATASLDTAMRQLLSMEGASQTVPPSRGWTVSQAIGNIEVVLNRRIPLPK